VCRAPQSDKRHNGVSRDSTGERFFCFWWHDVRQADRARSCRQHDGRVCLEECWRSETSSDGPAGS
jgi:hypothetical protein